MCKIIVCECGNTQLYIVVTCNTISNLILRFCTLSSIMYSSNMYVSCTVPQPPDPPGIVDSIIVNSTAIMLQWMEPLTTVLNITGYQILYRHPARGNGSDILIVLPSHQINITISGLDGGQLYLFNVSAVNVNGSGLPAVYAITTPVGM